MAHYAILDKHNTVIQVITGIDENILIDWELEYGKHFNAKCKRTSYNTFGNKHILGGTPFRKNYAGIGYKYDPQLDAFIPPNPYPSWRLNTETGLWDPPIPRPSDGKVYEWDELNRIWVLVYDTKDYEVS